MTEESKNGLTIVGLHAENIRKVKAVTIYPTATGVVKIKGRNAAGKSSCLDSIEAVLGGKTRQPEHPVRHGETEAVVVADLGGRYRVKRTWTKSGTYLSVEAVQDGGSVKVAKPQTFLDDLVGQGIGFDPLEFVTQKRPAEQVQMLLDVLQLPQDPRMLDQQRKDLYDQRTIVNRGLKQAEGHLASLPLVPDGTPEEESSIENLVAELNARQRISRENDNIRRAVQETNRERMAVEAQCAEDIRAAEKKVERLRAELTEAESDLAALCQICDGMLSEAVNRERLSCARAEGLVDPDTSDIQRQMADIQTINRRVGILKQRREAERAVAVVAKESDALTVQIEALDAKKAALLAQAQFPIPSLGIEEDGRGGYYVSYGGVPLADCSSSEQLKISMALAISLNPKVRVVLIREGSLLDEESRATIEAWAKEQGVQIWLELATVSREGGGFLIEEGELVEVQP